MAKRCSIVKKGVWFRPMFFCGNQTSNHRIIWNVANERLLKKAQMFVFVQFRDVSRVQKFKITPQIKDRQFRPRSLKAFFDPSELIKNVNYSLLSLASLSQGRKTKNNIFLPVKCILTGLCSYFLNLGQLHSKLRMLNINHYDANLMKVPSEGNSYPAATPIRRITKCQYWVATAIRHPQQLKSMIQTPKSLVLKATKKFTVDVWRLDEFISWSSSPWDFVSQKAHKNTRQGEDDDEDWPSQNLILKPLTRVFEITGTIAKTFASANNKCIMFE